MEQSGWEMVRASGIQNEHGTVNPINPIYFFIHIRFFWKCEEETRFYWLYKKKNYNKQKEIMCFIENLAWIFLFDFFSVDFGLKSISKLMSENGMSEH